MSVYSDLKTELEALLDKITEVEQEAAEERDSGSDAKAEALDAHAKRLTDLLPILKSKLHNTSPAGISPVELDHLHLTSKISREIRDCKIEIVCAGLSKLLPTDSEVDAARKNHIATLEALLNKLTR